MLRRMKGESGVAVFLGNVDAPANYRGNDYKFRQDSTFLYFWGIDEPCFAAVLDLETGAETLYADDVDIDDIVWMGPQPSVRSKAELVGVGENAGSTQDGVSAPYCKFFEAVAVAKAAGRLVHFVPQSRYYNQMHLAQVLGLAPELVSSRKLDGDSAASKALVRAIVSMRLVKQDCEIEAIDDACDLGVEMHTIAREGCRPGVLEQEIVGRMEGITLSKGWGVSFTTILSQNGETLHNHTHHQIITPGRLLVVDAGAESNIHYASDFTRTYPCGGKFTPQQKEIYDLVHSCNEFAFSMVRPGITYREIHIATVTKMLEGLKAAGLVSGDPAELAADGIGGLFMPHGLGHNMGLDVHDMEDYGEGILAVLAGAKYVAVYYNRMEDNCTDADTVITQLRSFINESGSDAKILAASFKNTAEVVHAFASGAHSATVGYGIIKNALGLPSIDAAVARFTEDFEEIHGEGATMETILKTDK